MPTRTKPPSNRSNYVTTVLVEHRRALAADPVGRHYSGSYTAFAHVRPSPQIDSVIFSSLFPHGRISSGDTHSTVLVDTNVWLVSRGVEGFDAWKENLQEKRLPSEAIAERLRSAVEEFFWTVPEDCQQLRLRALGNMQELDERSWDELNLRRLDLIEKDIETGLTSVENAELDDLDQRADEHLNAVAPLNWEIFEKLKEVAAKDGITVNLD